MADWKAIPGAAKADSTELRWRVRSFFWELVAALDIAHTYLGQSSDSALKALNRAQRERLEEEQWHVELREYRNSPHYACLPIMGEYAPDGRLRLLILPSVPPSREQHQIPERLQDYLVEASKTVGDLLSARDDSESATE